MNEYKYNLVNVEISKRMKRIHYSTKSQEKRSPIQILIAPNVA